MAQTRDLDRRAMVELGLAGRVLMQRAASASWHLIRQQWPECRHLGILCGRGNNGGDGYELARLARGAGWTVRLLRVGSPPVSGDAAAACHDWLAEGGASEEFSGTLPGVALWVDALFGIGLRAAPQGDAAAAILALNAVTAAGVPVLALDVPSGVDADTGAVPGVAVRATLTLSFIGDKPGLHTGSAVDHVGRVEVDRLGLPDALFGAMVPRARRLDSSDLDATVRPRARAAHKGGSGHVLIVGGNHGMTGAVLLAGRAALRSGAGLVSVATRGGAAAALVAAQPELMVHGVDLGSDLAPLIERADVIAIGPGLGQDDWARELWGAALASQRALILDADALNLLARDPRDLKDAVLTPHPGEAGRLLGVTTAEIQADRLAALQQLERRYAVPVVLKGAGTLVSGRPAVLCPYGNPGMAVGGSGDALTGIVAALRAQGLDAMASAQMGVLAHALAGDRAAAGGQRGLLPSDLVEQLRAVFAT